MITRKSEPKRQASMTVECVNSLRNKKPITDAAESHAACTRVKLQIRARNRSIESIVDAEWKEDYWLLWLTDHSRARTRSKSAFAESGRSTVWCVEWPIVLSLALRSFRRFDSTQIWANREDKRGDEYILQLCAHPCFTILCHTCNCQ